MSHSLGNDNYEFTIPHTVDAVFRRTYLFFSSEPRFKLKAEKDKTLDAHRNGEFMVHRGYDMLYSFFEMGGRDTSVFLSLKNVDTYCWPEVRHLIDWWTDFMKIPSLHLWTDED